MLGPLTDQLFESIVETIREPLLVLDSDLKILLANQSFCDSFKVTPEETLGNFIYDLGNRQWDIPKLRVLLEKIILKHNKFDNYEVEHEFLDIGHKIMRLNARRLIEEETGSQKILLGIEDITERRRLEDILTESEDRYRRVFETASDAILLLEKSEGKITHANPAVEAMLGYSNEECVGKKLQDTGLTHEMDDIPLIVKTLNKDGIIHYNDVSVQSKVGQLIDSDIYLVDKARLIQCNIRDITERKHTEELLRLSTRGLGIKDRITEIFLTTPNDEMYGEVLQVVLETMQSPYGTFAYINEDGDRVVPSMTRDIWDECKMADKDICFPREKWHDALWAKCLIEKKSVSSEGPFKVPEGHIAITRALAVPIIHQGQTIGNFMVGNKQTEYSHEDRELLEAIANQIAPILHARLLNERHEEKRKQVEKALRDSRNMLQTVLDSIPSAVFWKNRDLIYLGGNRTWLAATELKSSEEVVGKSDYDLPWEKGQADAFREDDRRVMESGIPEYGIIEPYLRADGTQAWAKTNKVPLRDKEGNVTGVLGTYEDITERKQDAEALRESEEKYRNIFNNAQVGIFRTRISDGKILDCNERFARTYGYKTCDECIDDFVVSEHYTTPGTREKMVASLMEKGEVNNIEACFSRKDGDDVWIRFSAHAYPEEGFLEGVGYDITEEKKTFAALQESEEKYRNILESMQEGYYEVDLAGNFTFFNDAMCRIRGYTKDEMMGMNNREYMDAETAKKVYKAFSEAYRTQKSIKGYEWEIMKRDGTKGYVEVSVGLIKDLAGNPIGFRGIARDITERKQAEKERARLEAQLQQARKMEAIGTLAGGIAHDFNNILAIILGNAELASDDVPDWNPASESLKEIHRASIRAKDMVRQLLAFSRKTDEESTLIDMAPIIKESMKMLRSAIPTSVEFKEHISNDPCNIMGDAAQINQVVMNLVTNATDAMSEEGGSLEVTLEKIILREEKPCFDWVLSPGTYVRLKMRDTGEGIDPKIMDRIFEPYYTTKDVGKGTGMGLSVVHGIVKRHGGGIRVESELGKGTLFEIYLPALEETAEEENEPEGDIQGGSERILFVDDEVSIANLNHQRLERLGYDVKSTTKPLEALEWFKADPDRFDVMITDMTMPRMTGDRLAAEVLKIRPHMPVIICTGYSERMSAKKAEALGLRKYIEKPVDLRNLASALREVLEET
ncbi:MAG: PAS domain S-box protein [Deltaproteobacteria bacterium]|nr:PAS domain S-box protein [Deltaproteobacteria bacterium]